MALQSIDRQILRSTLHKLNDLEWDWSANSFPSVAAHLGWDIVENIPDLGVIVEPHWNVGIDKVDVPVSDGKIDQILGRLTDTATEDDDSAQALQDAFVDSVSNAVQVLGVPTEQHPGMQPRVAWRGKSGTIQIKRFKTAVALTWSSNEFEDRMQLAGEGKP